MNTGDVPAPSGMLPTNSYIPANDNVEGGGTYTGNSTIPTVRDYENIFGPAARDIKSDPQRNRRHARWHLPDALKGPNPWLTDRIDGLITDTNDSPYTTVILPYKYIENVDQKIKWNVWSFDDGLASRVPYESAARTLTQTKRSYAGYTIRQGLAITMEHNFMMSEKGRENFKNQVQQVVGSIQHTNNIDVHMALIQAPSYARIVAEKYYTSTKTTHQVIREYIDLFGFMSKNPNAMDIMIEEAKQTMRTWGAKEPNFLLTNPKLTFQMTMIPEKTQYITQGLDGMKRLKAGPNIGSYRGLRIIPTQSFSMENGTPPRDVLSRRVRVAEYYRIKRPAGNVAEYTIELYDESKDAFESFTWNQLCRMAMLNGDGRVHDHDGMMPVGDEFNVFADGLRVHERGTGYKLDKDHLRRYYFSFQMYSKDPTKGIVLPGFDRKVDLCFTDKKTKKKFIEHLHSAEGFGRYLTAQVNIYKYMLEKCGAADHGYTRLEADHPMRTRKCIVSTQFKHEETLRDLLDYLFQSDAPAVETPPPREEDKTWWDHVKEHGAIRLQENSVYDRCHTTPFNDELNGIFTEFQTRGHQYFPGINASAMPLPDDDDSGKMYPADIPVYENIQEIILFRPCVEHNMLGIILGRGGLEDLGATLWGQTELSCYDDSMHGIWGMSYKYNEKAIVFNERNLTRLWDVAYDGYNGGKDTTHVDWQDNQSTSAFLNAVADLSKPYDGPSILAMSFQSQFKDSFPSPIVMHNDRNTAAPLYMDGENLNPIHPEKMFVFDDNGPNKARFAQYLQFLPDFSLLHQQKMAGNYSADNETAYVTMAFQGTHIMKKNGITVAHVNGNGHHGVDYVGAASVRAGKGLRMTPVDQPRNVHIC